MERKLLQAAVRKWAALRWVGLTEQPDVFGPV